MPPHGLLMAPAVWGQISFEGKVYPVLEAAGCRMCHTRAGVASGTRLHFPEAGAGAAEVRRFGLGLRVLGPLLLAKPLNQVRHVGGERIAAGSGEANVLGEWVSYLGGSSDVAGAAGGTGLGPRTRRLRLGMGKNSGVCFE